MQLKKQLTIYRQSVLLLNAEIQSYQEAKLKHELALDALTSAKDALILAGLEGKNEAYREAELRQKTAVEQAALHISKASLRRAEILLEQARNNERLERETLLVLRTLA